MSERIALIGFGGTIAMVPNEEGALAPAMNAEDLYERAPGLRESGADIDIINLTKKDSSNLNPDDWRMLIDKITELQPEYDGFLITHGTDTMPYTATAAAFVLGSKVTDERKPVVFTGSQLPIVDAGTDAKSNLERSMKVLQEARAKGITEVMIVFNDKVLRAARAIKNSESRFDAFASPAFGPLGEITANGVFFSPVALQPEGPTKRTIHSGLGANFDNGLVSLDVRPGIDPEMLRVVIRSNKCAALILKSLGAGNIPDEGELSLLPVIGEAVHDLRKPVIIATKFVGGKTDPNMYEPGRAALAAGAGHAGDMTDVAAEVKLMWLLGNNVGDRQPHTIADDMLRSYVGEVS